jgi:hypothetical protein
MNNMEKKMKFLKHIYAAIYSIVPSAGTNQIRFYGSAFASQPYGHPNVSKCIAGWEWRIKR